MSRQKLEQICEETFDFKGLPLAPDTQIRDLPNWDSFSHIQFVIAVEEEFGKRFTADQVQNLKTLGELMNLIAAEGAPVD
jgi:acyl carrier protein